MNIFLLSPFAHNKIHAEHLIENSLNKIHCSVNSVYMQYTFCTIVRGHTDIALKMFVF